MRILVDMDQVLAQWAERIVEWWNHDRGTDLKISDITDWDLTQSMGPGSRDFIRSCIRYTEFYRDLDPVPGAIDGMRKLVEDGHDVVITTYVPRCAGIAHQGKLEWIRRNMPFFHARNLVATERKELVRGDLLLDDGAHNIEAFRKTGGMTAVYDYPWNRSCTTATVRVAGWQEFLDFVADGCPTNADGSGILRSRPPT